MTGAVAAHYGAPEIVGKLLAAMGLERVPDGTLDAERLYPFDQFHGRELAATEAHVAALAPQAGEHVLDIGCGIGGPARYMATRFGCRVTGIDVTPDFVATAADLSRMCGLQDRLAFVSGDAAAMPFPDGSFDRAACFFVGMNLACKPAVLAEAVRVLKPGGPLLWTEAVAVEGPPHFPLPWAREPAVSFLSDRDGLLAAIRGAGFETVSCEDETAATLAHAARMRERAATMAEAHRQANAVVLGDDFAERRRNFVRSLAEGRLASLAVLARRV